MKLFRKSKLSIDQKSEQSTATLLENIESLPKKSLRSTFSNSLDSLSNAFKQTFKRRNFAKDKNIEKKDKIYAIKLRNKIKSPAFVIPHQQLKGFQQPQAYAKEQIDGSSNGTVMMHKGLALTNIKGSSDSRSIFEEDANPFDGLPIVNSISEQKDLIKEVIADLSTPKECMMATIEDSIDSIQNLTIQSEISLQETEEETRQRYLTALLNGTSNLSAKFKDFYELGELLGDGAFGFVFVCRRKSDNVDVAIKFIIRSKISKDCWAADYNQKSFPIEISIIRGLDHPNIIKYYEHIHENDYVLLVTELFGTAWDASNLELDPLNNPGLKFKFREKMFEAEGATVSNRTSCDLFECIDAHTRIPIRIAKYIFAQIVLACDYLALNDLVHRDIKDENIVVNAKYGIKLIDFGSASKIPSRREDYFSRYNGTPHFAAPEIVRGSKYQGPQAEVWYLFAKKDSWSAVVHHSFWRESLSEQRRYFEIQR